MATLLNLLNVSFSLSLSIQGPTIHYIDTPLAFWTVAYTKVAVVFSANAVSILGVAFAAAAARMFVSDSLKIRQLGVVMFKVRDYLDSLDGCVARARRNQVALTVEPGTMGKAIVCYDHKIRTCPSKIRTDRAHGFF